MQWVKGLEDEIYYLNEDKKAMQKRIDNYEEEVEKQQGLIKEFESSDECSRTRIQELETKIRQMQKEIEVKEEECSGNVMAYQESETKNKQLVARLMEMNLKIEMQKVSGLIHFDFYSRWLNTSTTSIQFDFNPTFVL